MFLFFHNFSRQFYSHGKLPALFVELPQHCVVILDRCVKDGKRAVEWFVVREVGQKVWNASGFRHKKLLVFEEIV